jgi:DNA-binding NtrC family response regulator
MLFIPPERWSCSRTSFTSLSSNRRSKQYPPQGKLFASLAALELEMITDALKFVRGNAARASQILGINERYMRLRPAMYGIDSKRFKKA